jgi:hypothetical protein
MHTHINNQQAHAPAGHKAEQGALWLNAQVGSLPHVYCKVIQVHMPAGHQDEQVAARVAAACGPGEAPPPAPPTHLIEQQHNPLVG